MIHWLSLKQSDYILVTDAMNARVANKFEHWPIEWIDVKHEAGKQDCPELR